jgi:hypothetical protein
MLYIKVPLQFYFAAGIILLLPEHNCNSFHRLVILQKLTATLLVKKSLAIMELKFFTTFIKIHQWTLF